MTTKTENDPGTEDPRLRFGCGSRCCARFDGEAKDMPFLRLATPLAEGPWNGLGKMVRFLRRLDGTPDRNELILDGNTNMVYGRCGLNNLLGFARQHDASYRSMARSWFTDADGRLVFQIDGECFAVAHLGGEEGLEFGEWLHDATSDPCPHCGGSGRTWPAGDGGE